MFTNTQAHAYAEHRADAVSCEYQKYAPHCRCTLHIAYSTLQMHIAPEKESYDLHGRCLYFYFHFQALNPTQPCKSSILSFWAFFLHESLQPNQNGPSQSLGDFCPCSFCKCFIFMYHKFSFSVSLTLITFLWSPTGAICVPLHQHTPCKHTS